MTDRDRHGLPTTAKFYMSTFSSQYLEAWEMNQFRNEAAKFETTEERCVELRKEAEALVEKKRNESSR